MAFPTTGVIDDFNRTNAATLGANWAVLPVAATGGTNRQRVVSNACGPDTDSGNSYSADYWSAATFGPDSEVYVDLPTNNSESEIFARLQSPGASATTDGYSAYGPSSGTGWALNRYDNGSFAVLGATFNITSFGNGSSLGLEVTGTGGTVTVALYHKPSAGSWGLVTSRADTAANRVVAAGYIGMVTQESLSAPRKDNFGGGTITAGGATTATAGSGIVGP